MTKQEFETIAKRSVTSEQYKAIETLYMSSNLDKYDFVKSIKTMLKAMPEEKKIKKVIIAVKEMPNGTYMTYEAEVIGCSIATGKMLVRRLSQNRCWAEINFDYYYTRVTEIK